MTIAPKDLKGVSSYQFGALRSQRFDAEQGQKTRCLSMRAASFAA
jgi:hypothetical protein